MEKIKVFWKNDCPKCPAAKAVVGESPKVELYNLDELDGLTEGAFYAVVSTPSIIITDSDGKELTSWRGEVPGRQDIAKWL